MLATLLCLAPLALSPAVPAPPGAHGPAGSSAQEVPRNEGWVTDDGGFLNRGEERRLEELMESFKRGSTHEIALLTVKSLEGGSLEAFSIEVARSWGLGGKDANNGALLLISRADRKMRIEVGRGLEGTLTDSVSGRIIREVMTPQFKRDRYFDGIEAGLRAMHAAVGGDYAALEKAGSQRPARGFQAVPSLLRQPEGEPEEGRDG